MSLFAQKILVQFSCLNFIFPVPLFHIPTISFKKDELNLLFPDWLETLTFFLCIYMNTAPPPPHTHTELTLSPFITRNQDYLDSVSHWYYTIFFLI